MTTTAHRHITLLSGVIAAALMLVAACDTSTDPDPNGSSGASSDEVDGGGSNSDASPNALGTKCAAEKTIESCASCCGGADSIAAYEEAFRACACGGPCQAQCASTLCAATASEPDDACDECFRSEETALACHADGADACDKNARCSDFIACDEVAQCLAKDPDADGG